MTCEQLPGVSGGGCNNCGTHADPLHFVEDVPGALAGRLLCATCCGVCNPKINRAWDSEIVPTITGEQVGLF